MGGDAGAGGGADGRPGGGGGKVYDSPLGALEGAKATPAVTGLPELTVAVGAAITAGAGAGLLSTGRGAFAPGVRPMRSTPALSSTGSDEPRSGGCSGVASGGFEGGVSTGTGLVEAWPRIADTVGPGARDGAAAVAAFVP
jgi:hypothetical protein